MRISSFCEEESSTPTYKVIVLGMAHTGKTALLRRYLFHHFQEHHSTTCCIDCSLLRTTHAKFAYYDTAGQDKYKSIINMYYKGVDAAILTYSLNDPASLDELTSYVRKLEETAPACKMYLVGCKSDKEVIVTNKDVEEKFPGVRHFVTSARLNKGVGEVFGTIERQLLRKKKGPSLILQAYQQMGVQKSKRGRQRNCCQ